ncbi:hypothetical protein QOZ80_7AG0577940 [Eleusine coracana subsp. coracana]|nr:hypothetical protein QOZ80_7AG0577940 [Eleusine coracana subsp. coracana]
MASTASDPCYHAAPPASALLDDHHHHHQLYLDPAAASADARQEPPAAAEPPPRKPRKRARASRRAPTTVLTTDASNFRAMVQEFTGFPAAPPPFAPHHLGPGALFGAGPSQSAAAPFHHHHQLLRPSPLKLSSSSATPAGPTTSNTGSFAHTLFASSSNANSTDAAAAPGWSSELYGRFGPAFAASAVPGYGEGFAAAMEGGRGEHGGHGVATAFLHAGDRYHDH